MEDLLLDIAEGKNRYVKVWKNNKIKWSDLKERLKTTHRTHETIAEYDKLPKSKQDDIKDLGGFVGGYLIKGKRSNVKFRQIIALDIDYGGLELWDAWELIYGKQACIYSTHKHRANRPRLRLIIPLKDKVDSDMYQAVARKIAFNLGIDAFDDTTYQPQRLMYWPSSSKDGEYIYKELDGEYLDPQEVLSDYEDWKDVTSWPTSSRAKDIVKISDKHQKDPLEKPGVIGAFCKVYDIHSAIEKFVEDYVPCSHEGRYTYVKGSTAAGVVTYDDKFSYSHHGTDPASGVLCNAFDLVRLHKFKDLDEEAKPDTPSNKLPSYLAMETLATKDKLVVKEIVRQKQEVLDEFDIEEDEEDQDQDWEADLQLTKKGAVISNYHNIELILKNDKIFRGAFAFNDMSKIEELIKDVPWKKYEPLNGAINDNDDANIRIYLEKKYGVTGKDKIFDVVNRLCHNNTYHPVKNYLEALSWDGVNRLDTLFIDYFAVDDTEYTRAVSRKTLLGAVTRIYEPGCKFDHMLTIKGAQGSGKSSIFSKLAGNWFTDSLKDIRGKDALEALQGVWIVEMAELSAMKKADAETIKSFLSGRVDRFRKAYGKRTEAYPRQCIFVATTNESEFLRDKTGNRRFWIIGASKSKKPKKNVFKMTQSDVDQIWAEAKALYDSGVENLYLSQDLEKEAQAIQEQYMLDDPKMEIIKSFLERKLPTNWEDMDLFSRQDWLNSNAKGEVERTRVCATEVWCEAFGNDDTKGLNRYEVGEINSVIDSLPNWEKTKNGIRFSIYGFNRGFKKV